MCLRKAKIQIKTISDATRFFNKYLSESYSGISFKLKGRLDCDITHFGDNFIKQFINEKKQESPDYRYEQCNRRWVSPRYFYKNTDEVVNDIYNLRKEINKAFKYND